MRPSIPRFLAVLLAALATCVANPVAAQQTVLIDNVHVLPMDSERVLEEHSVLVQAGIITAIGAAGTLSSPDEALHVDGDGGYLLPGLSDMHAHISGYADGEPTSGASRAAANQLLLYLATGVTLLRDTGGSNAHFEFREALETGEVLGPDLYFTSPVLEGANAVWGFSTKITDPAEVEPLIAAYARDGYWGVKTYHTLSADVFAAVVQAAERHNLPVIGHVPFEVGIDAALAAGMTSIEHLRGYDFDGLGLDELAADGGRSARRFRSIAEMSDERRAELVDRTRLAGTWNTPTLAIGRFLFDTDARAALAVHPRFAQVHPSMQAAVRNANALDAIFSPESKAALREVLPDQQRLIDELHEAGAGILIGTDAVVPAWVPGFTPIEEMKLLEEAGLSRFDVLQAATLAAAVSLGIETERGTVSVGKNASLILLRDDPLESLDALWQLEGVIHRGTWWSFDDLEKRLRDQAATFETAQGGS